MLVHRFFLSACLSAAVLLLCCRQVGAQQGPQLAPPAAAAPQIEVTPRPEGSGDERVKCPTREEIQQGLKSLKSVKTDIAAQGELPPNCAAEVFGHDIRPATNLPTARGFNATAFQWKAPGTCHRPLYFEDATLERYGQGHVRVLQPIVSGARFYGSMAALPYKMGVERPRKCMYTLGYFRPGTCAPRLRQKLPVELDASALEVGTIAGLILLVP